MGFSVVVSFESRDNSRRKEGRKKREKSILICECIFILLGDLDGMRRRREGEHTFSSSSRVCE